MKRISALIVVILNLLIPSTSFASSDPSFSYLDLSGTSRVEKTFYDESFILLGARAKISLELGDTIFVSAEAFAIKGDEVIDGDDTELKMSANTVAIGFQSHNGSGTTWYFDISYGEWIVDETIIFFGTPDTFRLEPDMIELSLGVRSMISNSVELNASYQRYQVDFNNGDDIYAADVFNGNTLRFGLGYQLVRHLQVVASYSTSSSELEFSTASLGLRYSF